MDSSSWLSPADVAEAVIQVVDATGLRAWMVFLIAVCGVAAWGIGRWRRST